MSEHVIFPKGLPLAAPVEAKPRRCADGSIRVGMLSDREPALGAWSGENIAASRWLGESDEQPS